MTRKEIITNIYSYGGLAGAIIIFIIIFMLYGDKPLHLRFFFAFVMMMISPGFTGCILGAVTFILLLPFYKKIPWDIKNNEEMIDKQTEEKENLSIKQQKFVVDDEDYQPLHRWEILDL